MYALKRETWLRILTKQLVDQAKPGPKTAELLDMPELFPSFYWLMEWMADIQRH